MAERTIEEVLAIKWPNERERAAAVMALLDKADDDSACDEILEEVLTTVGRVSGTNDPYTVAAMDEDALLVLADEVEPGLDQDIAAWREANDEPSDLAVKVREALFGQDGDKRTAYLILLLQKLEAEPIVYVPQGVLDTIKTATDVDLGERARIKREFMPQCKRLAALALQEDDPTRAFWNAIDQMCNDADGEGERIVIMIAAAKVATEEVLLELNAEEPEAADDGDDAGEQQGGDASKKEPEDDAEEGDGDEEPAERAQAS